MYHALLSGKFISKLSKSLNLGNGSTWPGHIALKMDSGIIQKIIQKNPQLKIVFIAGTNGKTTTNKVLGHILNAQGIRTIYNNSGANLLNGLASTLVLNSNAKGHIKQDALLFEVDENALPTVLEQIPQPDALILLNLFRDQLDRYGEVNTIAKKWKDAIQKLTENTLVIANADDPLIAYISSFAKNKRFFTIHDSYKNEKKLSHAVDSTLCPKCNHPLVYSKISYSHLGNYKCTNCNFKSPEAENFEFKTVLLGTYNAYNISSAILLSIQIFKLPEKDSIASISDFKPAFGRQETIDVNGKNVMLLLSKNPTGFNESLKVSIENKSFALLILLNDRVPDGQDISWIWDVDFEMLKDIKIPVFVSGDRAYDMANRLFFAGVTHEVYESPRPAYMDALTLTPTGKILTILPTYSAMLDIRKLISGKRIL